MNRTTMTTEHLAHRFTSLLREALTDEQWAEMRGKNESGARLNPPFRPAAAVAEASRPRHRHQHARGSP